MDVNKNFLALPRTLLMNYCIASTNSERILNLRTPGRETGMWSAYHTTSRTFYSVKHAIAYSLSRNDGVR